MVRILENLAKTGKGILILVCSIFFLAVAWGILQYCYNMRYNVVLYNPYWLNLVAVTVFCFLLLGVSSLFFSKQVLCKIWPLMIFLIVLTSLPGNNVNHLPLYMIRPLNCSSGLHRCLNDNIMWLDGRIACYKQVDLREPQSAAGDFIWQYCKKYAKTGSVQGSSAEKYKFFQCLYAEGYTNAE